MLWISVFIANAAVMVYEIVGARAIAPFVGGSSEVWSGVIAAVLGGMTIGYWLGGKLADNHPDTPWLGRALVLSSVFVILSWNLRDELFAIAPSIARIMPLTLAVFCIGILFFAPAAFALGTVGPFAAKVAIKRLDASARSVGRLSAVAAFGSVAGTIVVGSFLAPTFGNDVIVTSMSAILFLLGVASFDIHRLRSLWSSFLSLAIMITLIASALVTTSARNPNLIADIDTAYNRIWVMEGVYSARTVRFVRTDPYGTQCASFAANDGSTSIEPVFDYIQAFAVGPQLVHAATRPISALVVGGCNYSYPRWFLSLYASSTIDVAEIDPGMTRVAREWFGLTDNERLDIIHADGRMVVRDTAPGAYDLVVLDAFNSFSSIPFHLATKEAVASFKRTLAPEGFLVANAIGSIEGESSRFIRAYVATLRSVFPHVRIFTVAGASSRETPINLIVVAAREPFELPTEYAAREVEIDTDGVALLTDDYAPVDSLTAPNREWLLSRRR